MNTFNRLPQYQFGYIPDTAGVLVPAASYDFRNTFPSGLSFTRVSAANYWNSAGVRTAAGNNVPRIDYNPQTLQPRGLIIESAATNFLLNSLVPVTQAVNLANGTYTLWIEGSGSVTTTAGTAIGSGFGVATNASGLGTFGTPNVFTITTTGTVVFTVTGTVTAFQCETGGASSMITTTAAAATRAQEQVTVTGVPWYNIAEGTVISTSMLNANASTTAKVYAMTNAASSENDAITINYNSGSTDLLIRSGAATAATGTVPGNPAGMVLQKHGIAYKVNDFAFGYNGTIVGTSASGPVPTVALDSIAFGKRTVASNSQFLNGWLMDWSYYNTRLSNANMIVLLS